MPGLEVPQALWDAYTARAVGAGVPGNDGLGLLMGLVRCRMKGTDRTLCEVLSRFADLPGCGVCHACTTLREAGAAS